MLGSLIGSTFIAGVATAFYYTITFLWSIPNPPGALWAVFASVALVSILCNMISD